MLLYRSINVHLHPLLTCRFVNKNKSCMGLFKLCRCVLLPFLTGNSNAKIPRWSKRKATCVHYVNMTIGFRSFRELQISKTFVLYLQHIMQWWLQQSLPRVLGTWFPQSMRGVARERLDKRLLSLLTGPVLSRSLLTNTKTKNYIRELYESEQQTNKIICSLRWLILLNMEEI